MQVYLWLLTSPQKVVLRRIHKRSANMKKQTRQRKRTSTNIICRTLISSRYFISTSLCLRCSLEIGFPGRASALLTVIRSPEGTRRMVQEQIRQTNQPVHRLADLEKDEGWKHIFSGAFGEFGAHCEETCAEVPGPAHFHQLGKESGARHNTRRIASAYAST